MATEFVERRRSPRVTLPAGHELGLKVKAQVRLLDVSLSGVLLSSETPSRIGAKGRLQGVLDQDAFDAEIRVCRLADPPPADFPERPSGFGAVFTSLDDQSRQLLERFLAKAGS
jgi:hypothetical protein